MELFPPNSLLQKLTFSCVMGGNFDIRFKLKSNMLYKVGPPHSTTLTWPPQSFCCLVVLILDERLENVYNEIMIQPIIS